MATLRTFEELMAEYTERKDTMTREQALALGHLADSMPLLKSEIQHKAAALRRAADNLDELAESNQDIDRIVEDVLEKMARVAGDMRARDLYYYARKTEKAMDENEALA